jgi:hypothetical protein
VEAVEVRVSAGVGVGGQGRLREDVFRDLGEIEVVNSGGGGRDRRPRALFLSDDNAQAEEVVVEIHWNERAKKRRSVREDSKLLRRLTCLVAVSTTLRQFPDFPNGDFGTRIHTSTNERMRWIAILRMADSEQRV